MELKFSQTNPKVYCLCATRCLPWLGIFLASATYIGMTATVEHHVASATNRVVESQPSSVSYHVKLGSLPTPSGLAFQPSSQDWVLIHCPEDMTGSCGYLDLSLSTLNVLLWSWQIPVFCPRFPICPTVIAIREVEDDPIVSSGPIQKRRSLDG